MEETEDHEPLYQEKFTLGERGQKNCIKCGVGAKEGCSQHAVFGCTYYYCRFCDRLLKKYHRPGLLIDYLNDDHGGIPMTSVDKGILEARIERKNQNGAWDV